MKPNLSQVNGDVDLLILESSGKRGWLPPPFCSVDSVLYRMILGRRTRVAVIARKTQNGELSGHGRQFAEQLLLAHINSACWSCLDFLALCDVDSWRTQYLPIVQLWSKTEGYQRMQKEENSLLHCRIAPRVHRNSRQSGCECTHSLLWLLVSREYLSSNYLGCRWEEFPDFPPSSAKFLRSLIGCILWKSTMHTKRTDLIAIPEKQWPFFAHLLISIKDRPSRLERNCFNL